MKPSAQRGWPVAEDTTRDQIAVAGWLLANVRSNPDEVARLAWSIDPAAYSDVDAAAVVQAVRRAGGRAGLTMAEVLADVRSTPEGRDFDIARLAEAVADQTGASERSAMSLADAVAEGYRRRLFLDAVEDAMAAGADEDARGFLVGRLADIASRGKASSDYACDALAIADQWAQQTDERAIPTGFTALDRKLGGGLPVGITALSAMPGAGKSAFAGQLMLGALEHDRELRAVWFRGEMTNSLLWSRLVATWSAIRNPAVPRITAKDAMKRAAAAQKVSADLAIIVGGRLYIIDPPLTAERIASHVSRLRPHMIVVDYFQKCCASGFQDKRSELDHVLAAVSDITTRHDLATIIVSSMAGRHRSAGEATDIGAMTKESNRLDYDAHNYLALVSDKKDKGHDPRPVRLEVVKARTGGEGPLDLWFSGASMTFTPQATEDQERQAGGYADFDRFAVRSSR